MAKLIAKSSLTALLPLVAAGSRLGEVEAGQMTSIAPFDGKQKAATTALKELGLKFPGPNKVAVKGKTRLVWWGRGQAMLMGVEVPKALAGIAALSNQSDGWAVMELSGAQSEAVLARLAPIDLREAVFPKNTVARTMLGHMTATIVRVSDESFEIAIMRSFARTAVHEISVAMKSVAAQ